MKKTVRNHTVFIEEMKNINPDINILERYVNAKTKIKCSCKKCNGIWNPTPDSLLHGTGCPFCSGKKVLIGYNDMWTTNPELAKLLADPEDGYKYTQGSSQKVDWKCPICGNIIENKYIGNTNKNGLSCNICGDGISFPEKFMINLLKQLKIDYVFQYSPNWIKPKRYDFYIPSFNIIVEMDGEFHYKDNSISGQTLNYAIKIDDYKDKIAILHKINIIRIDCNYKNIDGFNYIKNSVLKSDLINIFDLSKINWNNIYKESQKNLVYEVCMYKNNNQTLSTFEIGNIFKLNRTTIIKYLKCGNKINWCSYDAKEEMRKSGLNQMGKMKNRNKKVICITTGNIFNSIQEAEEAIHCKGISNCCRHKNHYTGKLLNGTKLVWMYYDEYLKTIQSDKDLSA